MRHKSQMQTGKLCNVRLHACKTLAAPERVNAELVATRDGHAGDDERLGRVALRQDERARLAAAPARIVPRRPAWSGLRWGVRALQCHVSVSGAACDFPAQHACTMSAHEILRFCFSGHAATSMLLLMAKGMLHSAGCFRLAV